MKPEKTNIKKEARSLRRKVKQIDESRCNIKAKSREKAKIIKAHQDREIELKESRNSWKAKAKEQEKANDELDKKYKDIAALFEMKEEELKKILDEFEELKKKYHKGFGKARSR